MDVFRFTAGEGPLLVSNPHSGTFIPDNIKARMTPEGQAVPDTDWHVDQLYGFLSEQNVPTITATHSRYVVDLNRAVDDHSLYPGQFTTGLFPEVTFDGEAIYKQGNGVSDKEKHQRIEAYWRPYHDMLLEQLEKIKGEYGYALLWDAHSIKSEVPVFFAGRLPDLNFGTNGGKSCALDVEETFAPLLQTFPAYSHVFNGRFKGGFITRHYGRPDEGIHAIQLELSQTTYLDEAANSYDEKKAQRLAGLLEKLVRAFRSLN